MSLPYLNVLYIHGEWEGEERDCHVNVYSIASSLAATP